jgi:hypothetical protein
MTRLSMRLRERFENFKKKNPKMAHFIIVKDGVNSRFFDNKKAFLAYAYLGHSLENADVVVRELQEMYDFELIPVDNEGEAVFILPEEEFYLPSSEVQP